MRKIIFFFFIFLSLHSYPQFFKGGIFSGITTSQLSGDRLSGFNKIGLIAGGYTEYVLKSNKEFIRFSININQKGSQSKSTDSIYYKSKLNYIEFPLAYYFKISKKDIFLAPVIIPAYLFKTKEFDIYGEIPNQIPFRNYEIAAGISSIIKISNLFNLRIDYSNSIIPVRPHKSGYTYYFNRGQYNSLFSFIIEWKIL